MVYLHEENIEENLVHHWANEAKSSTDKTATFRIRQIETGIVYDDAIDVLPCKYTYEATDEEIVMDAVDE